MLKRDENIETLIDRNISVPYGIEISEVKDILPEIEELVYRVNMDGGLRGFHRAREVKRKNIEDYIYIVYSRDEKSVCMSVKKELSYWENDMYVQYDLLSKELHRINVKRAPRQLTTSVFLSRRMEDYIEKYQMHKYWEKIKVIYNERINTLVSCLQEKKRYLAMMQGEKEYESLKYDINDFENDMYQLAAIEINNKVYLYEETKLEEGLNDNINSIYLIMDLQDFGYEKPMVIRLSEKIGIVEHIEKKTMDEWFSEIRGKFVEFKSEEVIYQEEIPIPFWDIQKERTTPLCLHSIVDYLKKQYFMDFIGRKKEDFWWSREISVTTRLDDKRYDTSPEEEFSSDIFKGIYCKCSDINIEIGFLENINGCAINSKGFYYVKDNIIKFQDKVEGMEQTISETNRFINMFAMEEYLFVTEGKRFQYVRSGVFDDWYYAEHNEYKIIPNTRVINLKTKEEVAVWENFYPLSGINHTNGVCVIGEIVSDHIWNGYCLANLSDQSLKSMEDIEIRQKAKRMNISNQNCNSDIWSKVSMDSVIMRLQDDIYYYKDGLLKKVNCKK